MDIQKLVSFYETELGAHVKKILGDKLLNSTTFKGNTIICTSGAYPIITDRLLGKDNVFFQNYGARSLHDNDKDGQRIVRCDRNEWPYRAESVDGVVMVHDVEFIDEIDAYLREAWRVLKSEGGITMIIPNRQSSWTRSDQTPFGYGQLCHLKSIRKSLEKNRFCIDKITPCLFFPPYAPVTTIGRLARTAVEAMGGYTGFKGGVYVLEVSKHVYAPIKGLKEMVSSPARNLMPSRAKAVGKTISK